MKHYSRRLTFIPVLAFVMVSTSFAQPDRMRGADDYQVVINHEEQYSIHLAGQAPPRGWKKVGEPCSLKGCRQYIEKVWTDMRPLSLQRMMKSEKLDPDKGRYAVVINHEEQYSIWLADRDIPAGWKTVNFVGTRKECAGYIEKVWTDMRPLSLRVRLKKPDNR